MLVYDCRWKKTVGMKGVKEGRGAKEEESAADPAQSLPSLAPLFGSSAFPTLGVSLFPSPFACSPAVLRQDPTGHASAPSQGSSVFA